MDKRGYEVFAESVVPVIGKLFVFLRLVNERQFSVLLDESQENSHGPLFAMEVVELRSFFFLELLNFTIELLICEIDNGVDKRHPTGR